MPLPRAAASLWRAVLGVSTEIHRGGIPHERFGRSAWSGCGLMGSGIAQVSAAGRIPDRGARGVSAPLLDKGSGSIRKFLQGGVDKGKLAAADMEKTLANLSGTTETRATSPTATW